MSSQWYCMFRDIRVQYKYWNIITLSGAQRVSTFLRPELNITFVSKTAGYLKMVHNIINIVGSTFTGRNQNNEAWSLKSTVNNDELKRTI